MTVTVTLTRVAWIRDRSTPPGQSAPGRLNCPCGNAPITNFNQDEKIITCNCGERYTWDGWNVRYLSAERIRRYEEGYTSPFM